MTTPGRPYSPWPNRGWSHTPPLYFTPQYWLPYPLPPPPPVYQGVPHPYHRPSSGRNSPSRMIKPCNILDRFCPLDRLGIKWDVRENPSTISYSYGKSARKPSDGRLKGPATSPAIAAMHIVFADLPWTIDVPVDTAGIISVEKVLSAIHTCLQKPLTQAEWDGLEGSRRRKNAHKARLNRLSKGSVAFEVDAKVRRVDLLGGYVMYNGLMPTMPYDAPKEWLLTLEVEPELERY